MDESLNDKQRRNTTKKIEDILHEHSIVLYDINYISKDIVPFHKSDVGSKIGVREPPPFVSLGAFLKSQTNESAEPGVYILISNHLAERILKNDDKRIYMHQHKEAIGEIVHMPDVKYDVAVAKLSCDIGTFNTMLQTSLGKPALCNVVDILSGSRSLLGLKVYIRGAVTSPGFGKITVENFSFSSKESGVFIIVDDDEDDDNLFSVEGDSGSVVCAENTKRSCVDAISVVIGKFESREYAQQCPQYLTVSLKACLEELSRIHGRTFSICNAV